MVAIRIARARRRLTLGAELWLTISSAATGRDREIVFRHLGWSGEVPIALRALGEDYGITGERVRQIISGFARRVAQSNALRSILDQILYEIELNSPALAADLERKLSRTFGAPAVRVEAVCATAEMFGRQVPVAIESVGSLRLIVHKRDIGLAREILRQGRKLVSHFGISSISEVCKRIPGRTVVGSKTVRGVLGTMKSLHWLDQRCDWFWLDNLVRNPLANAATKLFSVAPRIHAKEFRAYILADRRWSQCPPPPTVVMIEFCRLACGCKIYGPYIVSDSPRTADETLSQTERIVHSVLTDGPPLLHRSNFERECLRRGIGRKTFDQYVTQLPILHRCAADVYRLRGRKFSRDDLRRALASGRHSA